MPGRCSSALLAIVLLACGDPDRDPSDEGVRTERTEPVLLPYDSLAIAEDQDVFIGSPFSLLVVPSSSTDGALEEIWVSDFYSNTLLHFDGRGRFVRSLGGTGEGPHEFSTIGQVFHSGDEVGAVELGRREVKWFGRTDGKHRRITSFTRGSIGISPPVSIGDALVFPLLDPIDHTSLGAYHPSRDRWERIGPLPEPYRRSYERGRGGFASFFRYLYVDRFDDSSVLMAFSGVDSLYHFDPRDTVATVLGAIPRRTRRGLEGECRFAADAPDPRLAMRECGPPRELFSPVSGAWMLDSRRVAVVHTDQHAEGEPPRVVVTGTSYLTILDLGTGQACVDLRIPGGLDARAVYDLKGSTLYILDRRVDDTRSTLWLIGVHVPDLAACPAGSRAAGWRVRSGISH